MNVHQRQTRKIMSAREVAEAVFAKRAAPVAAPRILEDVSGQRPDADRRRLLGLPLAKNDNAAPAPVATGSEPPTRETEHEKVFRLAGERKFEEAARLAARLINAGDVVGFLIYGHSSDYRRAKAWFDDMVKTTKRSAASVIHTITPELAQIIVENNDGNRRVNTANLATIMRDIADDRWQLNGASFALSKDGRNNDGQHRAFGVLLTGRSIKSGITFGLQRESMKTVDIGRKRTGADRLGIAGVSDYIKKSAIAGMLFEIYYGRKPTPAESDDYFHDNKDIIERAVSVMGSNINGVGPSAAGAAAVHLFKLGYQDQEIRQFFVDIRAGEGNGKRDPRRVLYRAIYDSRDKIKLSRDNWFRALVNHFIALKEGRKPFEVQYKQSVPEVV